MSVLKSYFDYSVNQFSPVVVDFSRVVNYDEKGVEHVTYEPFDSLSYQKSLGTVNDWELDSLLKAGINPNFSIRTGYNTRLAGVNDLNSVLVDVDNYFDKKDSE